MFVSPVNSAWDPLMCTVHRLFAGQMSVTIPWIVTDNILMCFSILKKCKKKGKRKTSYAGLFICIQMPSFKKKKINMFDIIISYISQFN